MAGGSGGEIVAGSGERARITNVAAPPINPARNSFASEGTKGKRSTISRDVPQIAMMASGRPQRFMISAGRNIVALPIVPV